MKVLIVDDEVIIREGIRKVISWEEHGFQLLEPVSSAERAIDVIHKNAPEIILTDIRMNGKSGLDLASFVYGQELSIEVIVLTGYDEFTYAQEALRQGVSDYLLKTSAPDDILRAVQKARDRLVDTREHVQWRQGERDRMISTLTKKIVNYTAEPKDINQLYTFLPELQNSPIQILLIDTPLETIQLEDNENLWNTYIFGKWIPLNEKTIIIVRRDPRLGDEYLLQMAIKKINQSLETPFFVGSVVSSLTNLPSSFEQAVSLILYKWLLPTHKIIGTNDIQHRVGISQTALLGDHEEKLFSYMNSGSEKEFKCWLMEIIDWLFTNSKATPGSIQLYVETLYVSMIRFTNRIVASIGKKTLNYRSLSSPGEWFPSPTESLIPSFLEVLDDYQNLVNRQNDFVQIAIHYIENKLDQALTLKEVAEQVYVHPNYLSEMLRKETGMSYVEFATDLRMKKAVQLLLHTPTKVKDVSNSVGYSDSKYFTSQFKKHTGLTPSQYRKIKRKDARI